MPLRSHRGIYVHNTSVFANCSERDRGSAVKEERSKVDEQEQVEKEAEEEEESGASRRHTSDLHGSPVCWRL